MAKVHPNLFTNTCSDQSSSEKETFTVWMKSLVCHGNGCTVFNSKGDVVFRVDNYQQRCSKKALLMDSTGNILFSLSKKVFGCWEGFKWINSDVRMEKPSFRVRRNRAIFGEDTTSCVVTVDSKNYYEIEGFEGKSTFKITDVSTGRVVAEAAEKQSSKLGVCLGSDVLRFSVENNVDQSFFMALLVVYGLINNKL